MSCGLVICSECKHEVHQDRDKQGNLYWYHCDTKTPRCEGAVSAYPQSNSEIKGRWCGADNLGASF